METVLLSPEEDDAAEALAAAVVVVVVVAVNEALSSAHTPGPENVQTPPTPTLPL
jgi:hypothetical protein